MGFCIFCCLGHSQTAAFISCRAVRAAGREPLARGRPHSCSPLVAAGVSLSEAGGRCVRILRACARRCWARGWRCAGTPRGWRASFVSSLARAAEGAREATGLTPTAASSGGRCVTVDAAGWGHCGGGDSACGAAKHGASFSFCTQTCCLPPPPLTRRLHALCGAAGRRGGHAASEGVERAEGGHVSGGSGGAVRR